MRHWLRGRAVLWLRRLLRLRLGRGTILWLSRAVLLLLRAVLWLLRLFVAVLWLLVRLVRARLLGLNIARVRLAGADLRLLWLNGKNLRLARAVVRVFRPELRLGGAVVGGDLGLSGTDGLDLGPVVWFAGAIALLAGTDFGLAGTVGRRSRVGAGEAGLGGDGPRCCDHGWAASVDVVELLAVLCRFALMLDLGGHGRDAGTAHG
ncbi:MAG TPA: hypothetical protein VHU44_07145, partial [Acidobacteriaceae bacterium]|nr:hypothetical protein [Acidobacteriaceae bacterium]